MTESREAISSRPILIVLWTLVIVGGGGGVLTSFFMPQHEQIALGLWWAATLFGAGIGGFIMKAVLDD